MQWDLVFGCAQGETVGFIEKQISILFFFLSLLSTYKTLLLVMQCCCLSVVNQIQILLKFFGSFI